MAAFATILLWIRLIRYLRAIPSMGSLIAVIVEIKGDIFRYFLLATIIFIPYVLSFWIIFGGPVSANNTAIAGSTRRDLSTPYHVAVMGFRITLIDSYPYDVSATYCNCKLSYNNTTKKLSIAYFKIVIEMASS